MSRDLPPISTPILVPPMLWDELMPSFEEVGPIKDDQRRFPKFNNLAHTGQKRNSTTLYGRCNKRFSKSPIKPALMPIILVDQKISYHWRTRMGYFLAKMEYVIRKRHVHAADAGVDVLIMDVTNADSNGMKWNYFK